MVNQDRNINVNSLWYKPLGKVYYKSKGGKLHSIMHINDFI